MSLNVWETIEWNLLSLQRSRGFRICSFKYECLLIVACWFYHLVPLCHHLPHRFVCDCSAKLHFWSVFLIWDMGTYWINFFSFRRKSNQVSSQRTFLTRDGYGLLRGGTCFGICGVSTQCGPAYFLTLKYTWKTKIVKATGNILSQTMGLTYSSARSHHIVWLRYHINHPDSDSRNYRCTWYKTLLLSLTYSLGSALTSAQPYPRCKSTRTSLF